MFLLVQNLGLIYYVLSVTLLVYSVTYISTLIHTYLHSGRGDLAKDPAIVPYGIPFLGNLLSWIYDPNHYLVRLTSKYGYTPFRLLLGPQKLFFVSSPDHIAEFFRTSGVTASHEFSLMAIRVLFGMPKEVIKRAYAKDNSGIAPKPLPGTNVAAKDRFFYLHHRLVLKQLSGNSLTGMTTRFLDVLDREFRAYDIGDQWIQIPDLFSWLENAVFTASVESLCGSEIFRICPDIVDDYRGFYQAAPTLLKGLPRYLSPKAYKKRDRFISSLKKWHRAAQENEPLKAFGEEEEGWDKWWGSLFVKQRKSLVLAMDGMTDEGMACDDVALILTANVNAIPSAAWLVIDILRQPSLFARVLPEVEPFILPDEGQRKRLDILELCNNPLLQSIYAETLRIRTANMLPRIIQTGEQPLKNWRFPKKAAVFILGNIAAFDKKVWNTGGDEDPHPIHEFWADRFLIYPNNPRSGPLRHQELTPNISAKNNEAIDIKRPQFSTAGLTGAWIPYGGGMNMCPGRHFAKQELIGTFAMLCAHFDLEILTGEDFKFEPDTGFRIFGTMPPKGKIPARVRRRAIPLRREE